MATFLGWLLFLPPWLLLALLNPGRTRRFMSVAFFTVVLCTILFQVSEKLNWWRVMDNEIFYLTHISAFVYGLLPVTTLLVFYFTYPNPWLYFGANLVLDAVQSFIISPYFFEKVGFYRMENLSHLGLYLMQLSVAVLIYGYQKWYERVLSYSDTGIPFEKKTINGPRIKEKAK